MDGKRSRRTTDLNGDLPLGPADKVRYFVWALREVLNAPSERPSSPVRPFLVESIPVEVKSPPESAPTPFRLYQDIASLALLRRYAPARADILDVGCGPGLGEHHFRVVGTAGSYLGIDVVADPAWAEIERRTAGSPLPCRFLEVDARAMDGLGPFDVVYSSSSLEHMPDLPRVISSIAAVTRAGGSSVHLVPGPFSVFLYGAHGYRRFSAGRIEALFRAVGFQVEGIYGLGGLASYVLHAVFATLPALVLRRDLRERSRSYALALRRALAVDRSVPLPHLGFALVARRTMS